MPSYLQLEKMLFSELKKEDDNLEKKISKLEFHCKLGLWFYSFDSPPFNKAYPKIVLQLCLTCRRKCSLLTRLYSVDSGSLHRKLLSRETSGGLRRHKVSRACDLQRV